MAWPGADPLAFFRGLIDDVDDQLGDLWPRRRSPAPSRRTRRTARDPARERAIAEAMAGERRRSARSGSRIVDAIITESLDAVGRERRDHEVADQGHDQQQRGQPHPVGVVDSRIGSGDTPLSSGGSSSAGIRP